MARRYGNLTFDKDGGSKTFSVSVSSPLTISDIIVSGDNWFTVNGSNGSYVASCSPSNIERNGSISIGIINQGTCGYITCYQSGAVLCQCSQVILSTRNAVFDSDGHLKTDLTYSLLGGSSCTGVFGIVGDSNIINCTMGSGHISATATTNPSTSQSIQGEMTITLDGQPCQENKISYTISPIGCSCGDFNLDTTAATWPSNQTYPTKRYYTKGDCIEITEMYESPERLEDMGHFTGRTASDSNGTYVEIWPTIANTRHSPYNSTWHVIYKKDGTQSCGNDEIVLKHEAVCDCSDFTLDTTAATWAASQTYPTKRYYTKGDCIEITEMYDNPEHFEDKDHFTGRTASDSNGTYVEVWPVSVNTKSTSCNATWCVKYKNGAQDCGIIEIPLTHEARE